MADEIVIEVADRSGLEVDVEALGTLFYDVLDKEGVTGAASLTFVTEEEVTELNKTHMGGDYATDVLSFPAAENAVQKLTPEHGLSPRVTEPLDQPVVEVGDVVVCPSVAQRQAKDHNWAESSELSLLVVHGALHLLGYDHQEPEEEKKMKSAEEAHLVRNSLEYVDTYET